MSGEKHPPELPTVVDEAGDSAPWVSQVGLAIFAVLALIFVVKVFGAKPVAAPAAEPQAAAEAAN